VSIDLMQRAISRFLVVSPMTKPILRFGIGRNDAMAHIIGSGH
jgi:hypothetical protein